MYPTEKKEIKDIAKLRTEVEHYFYYSELLQKNRTDEAGAKVAEVIKRIPNILARIHEIEKIDDEDKQKHQDFYENIDRQNKRAKTVLSIEEFEQEKILKQETVKKKVKKLKPSGFLNFIFHERKNLKKFAVQSGMLHSSLFGFKFRLSNHFFISLEDLNKQIDFSVVESLKFLLEISWGSLSKLQYNAVYTFYNFINQFIFFVSHIKHGSPIQELFLNVETLVPKFLEVVQDERYKNIIIEGVQLALSTHSKHKQAIASIMDIVLRVFNMKLSGKVNFYQIIISIYYVAYKKKIVLKDLVENYRVDPIPEEIYLCDKKIAQKIESRIDKINSEIESAEKQLYIVKSVIPTLHIGELSKSQDFTEVAIKVAKASGRLDRHKTDESAIIKYFEDDMLFSIQLLITGFLNLYTEILNGKIKVKVENSAKEVRIFENNVFKDLIDELKTQYKEIADFRSLNTHISITFQIYERYIKNRHLDIEKDEKACSLIFTTARIFYKIVYEINKHMYSHYYLMKNGIPDPIEMQEIMKHPLKITEEEMRVITYYCYQILKYNRQTGQSVIDVLNEIVMFSINVSYVLEVEEILEAERAKDFLLAKTDSLHKERARYL